MLADIRIDNATIIDGTGQDRYKGTVYVKDGKISAISRTTFSQEEGAPDGNAREIIDAQGHIVCPGFIDSHTHSDTMLLWNRQHAAGLCQGITTEILGQDGLSYAPLGRDNLQMYFKFLAGLNGAPNIPLDWSSVEEYRMKFDRTVAINTAYQVPHGALRLETVGMRDVPLIGSDMAKAQALLAQGLQEGAVAFSTGLSYYPCAFSDTDEMVELCKVVAEHNSVYVTHIRTVFREGQYIDPVLESIEIAERSGAKLHFSHYRTSIPTAGGVHHIMKDIDAAHERGVDVSLELYPYPFGSGYVVVLLPLWSAVDGYEAMLERLADRSQRQRLIEGMEQNTFPLRGYFTHLPKNVQYIGRTFIDVAQERGQSIPDMLCDLLLEENLEVGFFDADPAIFESDEGWDRFNMDCLELLSRPYYMIGSDSIPVGRNPHPRGFGTYPRFLRFCRDYNFSLETMINRMAKVPADRFGLKDRGQLKEGFAADIVIFDKDRVTDTATYKLSRSGPVGISHVLVNGQVAVRGEKPTAVFAGQALRRG